ncbi:FH protein interacting protein FIP2-like [Rosa chinensis]|uniref:FH protein interacting protein FIP2-like n=1 Tax=Rosa chinensis TaxID=74649 RepID=UPI000D0951B4|nr:FH protein interacting protein FIP2-like [Rosa chinensis]
MAVQMNEQDLPEHKAMSEEEFDSSSIVRLNIGGQQFCTTEGANLRHATLNNADLKNANLEGANLSYATLNNVDLTNANMKRASLFQAKLKGVKLSKTNLKYADLRGAYRCLSEADLEEAYLEGAKLTSCFPFLW